MTERKIKITISQLGNIEIDALGFKGQGCKDATEAIEKALAGGIEGVERNLKPEWHETEDENVTHETHTKGGW